MLHTDKSLKRQIMKKVTDKAESVDVQQVRCIADQRMYENKQANHARQDGAESI